MAERPLLIPGFPRVLHGVAHDPEPWQRAAADLDEDQRLLALAGVNATTLGVFGWSSYEPEEGRFVFDRLDQALDRAAAADQHVMLATPSGAMPPWLARRYAEARRIDRQGLREPFAGPNRHCWSSPVYREKVTIINRRLAARYAEHPALGLWHASYEYGGQCFCILCNEAFRAWLRVRYGTLDALNEAWCSRAFGHGYAAWEEIEPRAPLDGLALDYRRFNSAQVADFARMELGPLRELTPEVPCTTSFVGTGSGLDFAPWLGAVDFVVGSPRVPDADDETSGFRPAVRVSMQSDLYRNLRPNRPWLYRASDTKRARSAGASRAHRLEQYRTEMLQALAHGAEGTIFPRSRRGECERAEAVLGSTTQAEVAFVYDTEARWAFERASERELHARTYDQTALDHYLPFWQAGISVDLLASSRTFDGYALLVTPQLFLVGPGVADRLRAFVERGGIWVATLGTGYCDPAGQTFFDGLPGAGLAEVLGIENEVRAENGASEPAITAHRFGRGHAYYLGAHFDEATLDGFYMKLFHKHALRRNVAAKLPRGVTAQRRTVGERELLFVLNFTASEQRVLLDDGSYRRLDDSTPVGTTLVLPPFGSELVTRGM